MPVALCAMSHSPLMGSVDPPDATISAVRAALAHARAFVDDFRPDLVVVFAPDHYNGFLYEVMPPFCIGTQATSIGDYGLPDGPIPVDATTARTVVGRVLDDGVDVACSEYMRVDHGVVQPLTLLFDAFDATTIVPVFINCVAEPLGPATRAVRLGRAVGEALADDDRRILFLASGGLSHDPPVPRLAEAPPEVAEGITIRRSVSAEARQAREARTVAAARSFAAGDDRFRALNPAWDNGFLDACAAGHLARYATQPVSWFVEQAGHSSHEVRTWLAAHAALKVAGPYETTYRYYEPIREWFAGYAVATATPTQSRGAL